MIYRSYEYWYSCSVVFEAINLVYYVYRLRGIYLLPSPLLLTHTHTIPTLHRRRCFIMATATAAAKEAARKAVRAALAAMRSEEREALSLRVVHKVERERERERHR
jgi:hypothetical protein